jgi:CheY-like chemotaxis protein
VVVSIAVVSQTDSGIALRISVKDTGIGIAQEKQAMIFEQFAQADASTSRQFGGTGLGLAICKRLLELQGSRLQVISDVGRGSDFFFVQSFALAELSLAAKTEAIEPALSGQVRPLENVAILLVEDNAVNIMVAKALLERWGAAVDVALNGQEALDMLDLKRHTLVLMDMHMAVMDGYEATRRMREDGVRIPIVALTASVPTNTEQHLEIHGLDGIVLKPIVSDELLKGILAHLG